MEQPVLSTDKAVSESFLLGLCAIRNHIGLVVLLAFVNLIAAFFLTAPVYTTFLSVTGDTGFDVELSRGIDHVLWMDFQGDVLERLARFGAVVIPAILLAILWKIASTAGLIAALNARQSAAFFRGILRYTPGTLLLTVGYFPVAAAGLLVILVAVFGLSVIWPGEVGSFWIYGVILPFLLLLCFTMLNLMQDYGRILYIAGGFRLSEAWHRSVRWPFRHPGSITVYAIWLGIGAALLLLPILPDRQIATTSSWSLGLLFGLQQLILVARSAATVGWFGSEVAFFERVQPVELPTPPQPEESLSEPEQSPESPEDETI